MKKILQKMFPNQDGPPTAYWVNLVIFCICSLLIGFIPGEIYLLYGVFTCLWGLIGIINHFYFMAKGRGLFG